MDQFKVLINDFDGPLDLMLHLIREKKMDIFNLDLNELADQYIDYIRAMESMHLEVASEFLVEMAQLIEYKSKKLLPKDTSDLPDDYEESTRERLVQRLLEYQRFKEVTSTFQKLSYERGLQFEKPESDIASFYRNQVDEQVNSDGTMAELLRAMNQCIKRYQILQPLPISIAHKEVSAEERSVTLRKTINNFKEEFLLDDLCKDCPDVYLVIVTFLSVLDMIKNGELLASVMDQKIVLRRGVAYGKY